MTSRASAAPLTEPTLLQTLMVNEIFYSIQGESTWSGRPCVFVRLTGCPLRCDYCDTEYAFYEGARRNLGDIVAEVGQHDCQLVEVTGGEPLLQPNVHTLMAVLADTGRTILLETSGSCDISACDPRVIRILDVKTPGSGEADRNLWSNLDDLTPQDEVKFVICSRDDYEWSREVVRRYRLEHAVKAVLFSPATAKGGEAAQTNGVPARDLARWILADSLPVRLQLQLHKLVWDPRQRGV